MIFTKALRSTTLKNRVLSTLSSYRTVAQAHAYSTLGKPTPITIVEVGPRDGLQNEKGIVPVEVKVELINRLAAAGLSTIEAGSFVSPKWVPQMAGTAEVIKRMDRLPGVRYPVLVPNERGLNDLLALLSSDESSEPPPTDEISIFTGATDAFTLANTNRTIAQSLADLAPVVERALSNGLRVRGYISVVVTCPYSGKVNPEKVRDVANELMQMGCYEISLGDTVGTGTPTTVTTMIEEVRKRVPVEMLAGHFHDTYGTGVINVFTALSHGIRTIDSSVGGLGGCPYSPGATGNVATEDVLYALQGSGYIIKGSQYSGVKEVDVTKLAEIGWWISERLGRETASRAGKAIMSKKLREKKELRTKL